MLDILIHNGTILDGTGNPGFKGAVGITEDTISLHRGDISNVEAQRYIDAEGYVVSPGFVDLHSHAGLTILGAPHHDPKIRQGVTTELIGIDGISHAPFKTREELERYIWLDSGLNGYPPMPPDWLTVSDLLSKYENTVAVNVAYILGNSPVRIWSVGWEQRPATDAEIANMRSVVREGMEEGAYGISTGLDYPPGAYASTNELIELSEESAKLGGFYHTHTRASLKEKGVLAPWEESIEIGHKSGIPIHLTHFRQGYQGDGSHLDYLALVDNARDNGLDVTFDCYTYPYSGTTITIGFPHWAKDGGPERLIAALKDPDDRSKMKKEITIALFDLLLDENLGLSTVGLGTNPQTLPAFVSHPAGMVASDAILFGEYPNPRTYGCFPVVLAEFVRAEKQLRLPEAIRKMTSFPAQRLGLKDRGLIRDGYKADIVLFNPDTVKAPATKENPKQYPIGIDYVIVNGKLVIDEGNNTGVTPGRALRRGRD
jgi:N-acyl-D-amino-acid deacylase